LGDFLGDSESELEEAVFNDIIHRLNGLQCTFLNHFPSAADVSWVRNPFLDPKKPDKSVQHYECLANITSEFTLKQKLDQASLTEFWCSLLQEYSELSKSAVLQPLPFPTAYQCQVEFSRHAATKNKILQQTGCCTQHEDSALHHHSQLSATLRQENKIPLLTLMTQGKVKNKHVSTVPFERSRN
jgi:hypothetical protein